VRGGGAARCQGREGLGGLVAAAGQGGLLVDHRMGTTIAMKTLMTMTTKVLPLQCDKNCHDNTDNKNPVMVLTFKK
jgi:hypothetical protein